MENQTRVVKWVRSRFARSSAIVSWGCWYRISSQLIGRSSSQILSIRSIKWSMHMTCCSKFTISTLGGRWSGILKIGTNDGGKGGNGIALYQAKVMLGVGRVVGSSLNTAESFFTSWRTLSDMALMCEDSEVVAQSILCTATSKWSAMMAHTIMIPIMVVPTMI